MCVIYKEYIEAESRTVVTRGWERGKWGDVGQGYKVTVMGMDNSRHVMCSLMTVVNNNGLNSEKC